ncbi:DEAD/DEAH box helicase [Amylibacter ulvae]|uniref:DEAD/DEAH box helicase n=1 Tax=Paramylibacter ulvae TaxID=1651968 RepID=A0ABQ3CZ80_9RHOB|nr:DEAD/DEAH box helicase [Amylibacter ulvae]GHA50924.1 DEAD/DEAH box helicase [Amylibacter ulvae]
MKQTIAAALDARGYTTLTAVQQAVTEPDTSGRDMLVSAQTGSGKTLGFGLAIAPTLLGDADVFEQAGSPLALIIAPTRELALQVKRELDWLFAKAGATVRSTVGGMDMRDERRALARGAHIVVATPGRLRDHIMRGSINLGSLRAVVLDEADEMLDLGFREDLEFILENAPADRQTLLFSATVPNAIAKLAKSYQKDALRIAATSGETQHADIDYHACRVAPRDGENAIINVLRYYEAPNALVFCNTRAMVNRLTTRLSNRGFSVVALSGELSQSERTHALQAMRDGRARVCVATDVAARGIDLPNLDLVVHAEIPINQETLLHRSGRTGRAGRKGVSVMIVPPSARRKCERLLSSAKLTANWTDAPTAKMVSAKDEERMLENPDWLADIAPSDAGTVEKITEQFSATQIAAAYLRLYREKHTAPEELSTPNDDKNTPRKAFGPSVWFSLAGGRNAGAEPRRLLPMVCKLGNISSDDIGAIRLQSDMSFIEIRKSAVAGFLAAVGPDMVLEDGAPLTQLASAPKLDKSSGRGKPRHNDRKPRGNDNRDRKTGGRDDRHVDRKAAPTDKPKSDKRNANTACGPIDWNDDPKPKVRKPKGGGKTSRTPRDKDAPSGPKPPAGKPSSKKNRARKAAAKDAKKQKNRNG